MQVLDEYRRDSGDEGVVSISLTVSQNDNGGMENHPPWKFPYSSKIVRFDPVRPLAGLLLTTVMETQGQRPSEQILQ